METEKYMCLVAMVVAGLLTLVFLLDVSIGVPFSHPSRLLDIFFILAGAFVLWQGYDTYRQLA